VLDIEEPAGRARCNRRGAAFATPDLLTACACGSYDVSRLQGEELVIRSIELEEAA
jgi:hydrogenase nickel incorporation protein HypA/HybF